VVSRLTAQEATVKTATVEIKALTVSGKQVTMGVFRQLINEPVIDDWGNLEGIAWGRVNYFFGDCKPDHMHVVWQKGTELRRACVFDKPGADSDYYLTLRASVEGALEDFTGIRAMHGIYPEHIRHSDRFIQWSVPGYDRSALVFIVRLDDSLYNLALEAARGYYNNADKSRYWRDRETALRSALAGALRKRNIDAEAVNLRTYWGLQVEPHIEEVRQFRRKWDATRNAIAHTDQLFIAV
jgi:hypothetical protein